MVNFNIFLPWKVTRKCIRFAIAFMLWNLLNVWACLIYLLCQCRMMMMMIVGKFEILRKLSMFHSLLFPEFHTHHLCQESFAFQDLQSLCTWVNLQASCIALRAGRFQLDYTVTTVDIPLPQTLFLPLVVITVLQKGDCLLWNAGTRLTNPFQPWMGPLEPCLAVGGLL